MNSDPVMLRYFAGFALGFCFLSCGQGEKNGARRTAKEHPVSVGHAYGHGHISPKSAALIDRDKVPRILLPATYRIIDGVDPTQPITGDWLGIFQQTQNHFVIKKADFSLSTGFDDCSGDSTRIIQSRRNDLLYIENTGILEGVIDDAMTMPDNHRLWPGETIRLTGSCKAFRFIAEGEKSNHQLVYTDEGPEDWYEVSHYKLYLKPENTSRLLLLEEEHFEDTFIRVLFGGDINGDRAPDFIMDVPRHYEETRVLLLLSTGTGEDLRYRTAEVAVSRDC